MPCRAYLRHGASLNLAPDYIRSMLRRMQPYRGPHHSSLCPRQIAAVIMLTGMAAGATAQKPDNTVAAVLAMPDDSAKVYQLSDLCYAYRRSNADSALLFGNAALQLAKRLHFARGEAQACNDLAIIHIDRSAYTTADSLLRGSLTLRTQLKDSAGMAAVHNKLGIIFQSRLMLEEALEEDLQALRIYERTGPPANEATILNNIGILQFNLRRPDDALATHRQAAAIRERIGDGAGLAQSRGNMANVEALLGDTSTAIRHFLDAIAYFREHALMPELAVQLNNLAGIYMAQGNLAAAVERYNEALKIRRDAGQRKAIASSLIGLGSAQLRQGRMESAKRNLLDGLYISRQVGARSEQMQAYLDLARLHARLDHGDSSFRYHQQYSALRDSIFNEDLKARLAQAEAKFETEKKESRIQAQRAEIAELHRQSDHRKLLLTAAAAAIALIVLTSLLLMQVQRRRSRAKHDALRITEREAGLRGVLEATERERKRIAAELHDSVGQQLTGLKFRLEDIAATTDRGQHVDPAVLTGALTIADDASREVRQIAHAMMPKALEESGLEPAIGEMMQRSLGAAGIAHELERFGTGERLPSEVEVGVYRIAQELVQNTMKHARAKQVNVQLLKNNGNLVFIYEDDGQGLVGTPALEGIGIRNIKERTHALRGTISIGNGAMQGMVATLRVPLH